jgi:diguanylate cyclase (GGDEF)-like protein/PAS domain S-box-containing protein
MPGHNETDFQFLAENSVDILCRAGIDRILRYVSPSCLHVIGWKPEEMTGKLMDHFTLPEDFPVLAAAIASDSPPGTQIVSATIRMLKKDGSTTWMENHARRVRSATTGELTDFVVTMRDISERKRLEEQLSALARSDSLTKLPNRRAFDEALEREWKRALREGSQVSLLLLDVDHFKELNDKHGHGAGDDCLCAIAAAVSETVRATDTAARFGGDEITIILPSTDIAGAVEAAERMRSAIQALRIPHQGNPEGGGWASASIGATTAFGSYGTIRMPEGLLRAADTALYRAKHGGRNRVATTPLVAPATRGPRD